ncbi:hypothetical protein EGR_05976 [Echinococcus granulosus]|uniref:Uncharacterized protein n=1 Tax=Echinococcus granulosus TaxID=6210 RepID=W6UDL1_ECHGR|nr:hypothetical protein EGR_05976 [Echinococcus granulosus]EUB59113.1 hypothetical protein EGR_05976 [Echinococcus granulosus]
MRLLDALSPFYFVLICVKEQQQGGEDADRFLAVKNGELRSHQQVTNSSDVHRYPRGRVLAAIPQSCLRLAQSRLPFIHRSHHYLQSLFPFSYLYEL